MNEQWADRPDVLVRRLAADDWRQSRATRLAALADAPYAFSSTLAKEQAYPEELWRSRAGSGRTFGAFDGGTLIGLATGIPTDELDGHTASGADLQPDWHLVGMWVAPDYRGTGVAGRLVSAVCERAFQSGAATVTLWVAEKNDRATALYKRHGFAPTGVRQLTRPDEPDHWEKQLALRLR